MTHWNVRDFGAKGDGATDDTAAFQGALDAARKGGGGIVFAPAGKYLFKGNLKVPSAVTLEGTFRSVPAHNGIRDKGLPKPGDDGTTLLVTAGRGQETGEPFLSLTTNSTVKGLVIYYPDQDPKATPVAYPWAIAMRGKNPAVLDVELLNPYQGIDATENERHNIRNVHGQPLRRGIVVDQVYDIGRIEDVHFNPWWSCSEAVVKFMVTEGEAFILGKTDWEYMVNCFSIIYKTGFRFTQFKHGPGNVDLTQCGHDIAPCVVRVEHSQPHAGIAFNNCQMMGTVEVLPTNEGPVKFSNCGFWGVSPGDFQNPGTTSTAILAGSGHVTFNGCHFTWWDKKNENAPCIRARCEGLTVMACDFMDPKPQLEIDAAVKACIIVGNRFRHGAKIANKAEGAQIGLNVEK
ncbi:MAG: glycosyl hydrolase family 28-related protein [Planctomycetota bacterium]|nr:glycosyl hydrolase family 28-related protein [Planctomycetota bacterium]